MTEGKEADAYHRAFVSEAEHRGYSGVILVDGVWCADASSLPGWARKAPEGAPDGKRTIPGTDQLSIGRKADMLIMD